MINKVFNSKTKNFTAAAIIVAFFTFLSAMLGFFRDRLLAGTFGAGETLDIYFAAFRIPDLLCGILVVGGIEAAFLPIFSRESEKGQDRAFKFANNILNCSLAWLLFISLVLAIFMPWALRLVTPGFSFEQRAQTIVLARIMLLSPILFCASTIFSGILQYFDKFLAYSLAPILYNLGIIFGILFFVPCFGISGLAWGVIFGAMLHFLIQVPAARVSGFHYSKILDFKEETFAKILKLLTPSAIGAGFFQINLIVITALCSLLVPGTIAIFNFSRNLQYFPIGMIGVPFAISTFPLLSKKWAFEEKQSFWDSFSLALRQILFLAIPISILIFILRAQIVRLVLGAGLWGWTETRLTAACLGIFSLSISAISLSSFFQKSFYSIHDTKTPTLIQIINVIMSITLSILFLTILESPSALRDFIKDLLKLESIKNIQVIAFPMALTIAGIFQSVSLFFIFVKKVGFAKLNEIFLFLRNDLVLGGFMGIGVWLILRPLSDIFPLTTFFGVFFQTITASLFGVFLYLLGALILKSPELKNLGRSIFRR